MRDGKEAERRVARWLSEHPAWRYGHVVTARSLSGGLARGEDLLRADGTKLPVSIELLFGQYGRIRVPPHRCRGRGRGHPRLDGGNVAHDSPRIPDGTYNGSYRRPKNTGPLAGRGAYSLDRRIQAFEAKFTRAGEDECWRWRAASNKTGYGIFWNGSRTVVAHRYAYELWVGPIPDGLTLDHLCQNKWCVNPVHMEPVTHRENNLRGNSMSARHARKTHCVNGHEFTPENIYSPPSYPTSRQCRTCIRERKRS